MGSSHLGAVTKGSTQMNDPLRDHPRCRFEAYEPYRRCTKRASAICEQCGTPCCAEHVRQSASGRALCFTCTKEAVAGQRSSAPAPVPPPLPLGQRHCPSCGGGRIYQPTG